MERLFLAVALDDDVRHGLAAFLKANLDGASMPGKIPGKAVPPANWHVTLRFLGDSTPEQAERVVGFLDERLAVAPFTVGFGGIGAFPRPSRATVLWLGIERGVDAIAGVAVACEEAAVAAGFEPEDRPFHPHLTLARIRPQRDVSSLTHRFPPFTLTQRVHEVTLYESRSGRGGAVYEEVTTVSLHG
jgi:2'-5' RNA ligase